MAPGPVVAEVVGHEDVRRDLAAAARRGDLPGSLLIHGPPGVGRQSLARWLARLLVCETPRPDEPCGECRGCHLALELQHPDIHWFFPLPRPKGATGPEKLADALETARFEALAARRANPLHRPAEDEPSGLYLAQVRSIRRVAGARPAMARRQVIIVGHA
jgi:DNA polymerase III subunit delta'